MVGRHYPTREGNLKFAQRLLKFGIDIHSHDRQGLTPLQIAAEGGHDKVQ